MGTLILVSRRQHAELWHDDVSGWSLLDERLTKELSDEEVRRGFGDEPFDRLEQLRQGRMTPGRYFAPLVSRRTVTAADAAGWSVAADEDDRFVAVSGVVAVAEPDPDSDPEPEPDSIPVPGPAEKRVEVTTDARGRVHVTLTVDGDTIAMGQSADLGAVEAVVRAMLDGVEVPSAAGDAVYWGDDDERDRR